MRIHFWGVRGSIPAPGPETAGYGGNTSCVSVELRDGRILIFDAGTGIRDCGQWLADRGGPVEATLLISHTHWDHIQGFPFFVPSFSPQNRLLVCGPSSDVRPLDIRGIMEMQTRYEFFPVKVDELAADIRYCSTTPGPLAIDGLEVTALRLNHPVPCFAYRLVADGVTYVYGGDHEPYRNVYRGDTSAAAEYDEEMLRDLDREVTERQATLTAFLAGADCVSWDSMYTREEYAAGKQGWGHSWYEANAALARDAGVGRMIFTHHDPASTDEILARREATWCQRAAEEEWDLLFAREGLELELP
jgi:phosphoribosyl 1,2-cyclic phosphodiesterase